MLIRNTLLSANKIPFITLFSATSVLINLFCNIVDSCLPTLYQSSPNPITKYSLTVQIIIGILFAPIFETFLFWSVPYWFYRRILKEKYLTVFTIFSSLIFGFGHFYGIIYVVAMFLIAISFWCAYFLSISRNENPFLNITLIHFIHNCFALLISYI